ncbi:MAG: aspartate aminotransferase family protein [Candidatus Omnitrophica bacterium]|nr:aspartate aminotransferase family protein [Candidatus Omnitrophota bacterium]
MIALKSKSQTTFNLLRAYESPNVTFIEDGGAWPIVWERARDVWVWDDRGKKYLDLTAGFGVAAAGHANPRVVKAGQAQMETLLHAMGDVHPHRLKAELARKLSRITFERWSSPSNKPNSDPQSPPRITGKTIFCNSGFEAVEAALKTAMLATGKRGVIAFEQAYHGLGYGALNATHRDYFRAPFRSQLGRFGQFVPFPVRIDHLKHIDILLQDLFMHYPIGAVLVEPVQGRGGIHIPPPEFLRHLRALCDRQQALLILDEIYTGFGRTGRWFACEHFRIIPDLVCLGKALTGGFPLSACVGRAEVMDNAWPRSSGEAIHTSTFLGHPVGCAMALAQAGEIRRRNLVERSERLGNYLLTCLKQLPPPPNHRLAARGLGLMAGLEITSSDGAPATALVMEVIKEMLRRGFILLPEGQHANVISFTPPLTITRVQLRRTLEVLGEVLATGAGTPA